jgi:putative transposase
MPRKARLVIPKLPCHITQRGNNHQDVFFVDDDRRAYLAILKEQSDRYGLKILGYCLMTNHVHLIAIPSSPESLARAVGRTNWRYTQTINRLHGRSGHLWQNRFYSCALQKERLLVAMAYVERNPVRAKINRNPWKYEWSSAAAHVEGTDGKGIIDTAYWRKQTGDLDWKEFLSRPEDKEIADQLRLHTNRGRPLGSDSFISKLEKAIGRRIRPLPPHRPRKKAAKAR